MSKHIANIVTSCRIAGSVLLSFCNAFSIKFYIIYVICGFSDMIDGTIARKTHGDSQWGAKLDTVADFSFMTASLIKILPMLNIDKWLWLWCIVIAIIKLGNIIWGYISKKEFISLHTIMNKITGFLLFLLPLTLSFVELKCSLIVICSTATFAAIQEWFYIVTNCENKYVNSDLTDR